MSRLDDIKTLVDTFVPNKISSDTMKSLEKKYLSSSVMTKQESMDHMWNEFFNYSTDEEKNELKSFSKQEKASAKELLWVHLILWINRPLEKHINVN